MTGGAELQGHRFTTSQGTLQLWRRGAGKVVLLLHDLGSSHASFSGVAPHLVRAHHVCAADLLGHGGSSREVLDLSAANQTAALAEILVELGFQGACAVGHGFGGSVAIRLAAAMPDRIEKLVLIAAGSYRDGVPFVLRFLRSRISWSLWGLLGRAARRRVVARLGARTSPESASPERLDGYQTFAHWSALGRAYRQNSSLEALAEMEELVERYLVCPTLAVWGTDDPLAPIEQARRVFQDRRNVRLIEIAGGSHLPHEDSPAIVAELVLDFLK